MKHKYVKIILFFVSVILFSFIVYLRVNRFKEDELLKKRIMDQIKYDDKVIFENLTSFDWDELFVFPPYSDPQKILKDKGYKNINHRFTIKHSDDHILILFTYQQEAVTYVKLPINYIRTDNSYLVFQSTNHRFLVIEEVLFFNIY